MLTQEKAMDHFEVTFPGGVTVDATFRGHIVKTDQPSPLGGDTAMSPFDLFLASIATCMGFYALRFCQERKIDTVGLSLSLTPRRDPSTKRLSDIGVELQTPPGFPDKYEKAIHRAMDECAVKKVLLDPPRFEIAVVPAGVSA
jgi:ribosomal protein S12 methylthiotransferase accessory factor